MGPSKVPPPNPAGDPMRGEDLLLTFISRKQLILRCNCGIMGFKLIGSVSARVLMHAELPFVKPHGKSKTTAMRKRTTCSK